MPSTSGSSSQSLLLGEQSAAEVRRDDELSVAREERLEGGMEIGSGPEHVSNTVVVETAHIQPVTATPSTSAATSSK